MADREKLVEALRGDAKDLGFLATGESAMLATSVAAEIRDHLLAAADLLDEGRETEESGHAAPLAILCAIGSAVVHAHEHMVTNHVADHEAFYSALRSPGVAEYLNALAASGLIPVLRESTPALTPQPERKP